MKKLTLFVEYHLPVVLVLNRSITHIASSRLRTCLPYVRGIWHCIPSNGSDGTNSDRSGSCSFDLAVVELAIAAGVGGIDRSSSDKVCVAHVQHPSAP